MILKVPLKKGGYRGMFTPLAEGIPLGKSPLDRGDF